MHKTKLALREQHMLHHTLPYLIFKISNFLQLVHINISFILAHRYRNTFRLFIYTIIFYRLFYHHKTPTSSKHFRTSHPLHCASVGETRILVVLVGKTRILGQLTFLSSIEFDRSPRSTQHHTLNMIRIFQSYCLMSI